MTTGSTTTTIDQGIGAVSTNSTISVAPTQTTTYTITAESSGGTRTASVALTVLPATNQSASALSVIKPSTANFTGRAFPGAQVTLMEKLYEQNIILGQGIPVSDSGNFTLWGIPTGYHAYGLVVKDKNGRSTAIKLFDREFINDSFAIANILMSPTIEVTPTAVTKEQTTTIIGSAFPGSSVEINLDNDKTFKTTADNSGAYTLKIATSNLALGSHAVRSKQTTPDGQISDYSLSRTFSVSATSIVKADFNDDGVIDIKDWSIFLANWKQTTPQAKQLIDLNGDGKVDISDVSIFLKTFKK